MRDDKDRSSKWLIDHHGDSILRLSGVEGFRGWRPVPADVVQPRQLPDGLLEVTFPDQEVPDAFVVEIATYPERRVEEQAVRDAMLVFLDRRVLPEVITLVLHPRGSFRVTGTQELVSRRRLTRGTWSWLVVELWTLPADRLLAANDVGLVPWLPLTRFEGPPEVLVRQCRERIEQQGRPEEQVNLLAVTQVMTRLRYNDPGLLSILGGGRVMIESPLIQELFADRDRNKLQSYILKVLEGRFGPVASDLAAQIRAVSDVQKLEDLLTQAALCTGLESFRTQVFS
jgi:hypothetical protein